MILRSLRVQNMRSHHDYYLDFSPNTTTIVGPNGSGKTSLAEAVYVALRGNSFRGGDADMVRRGESWYRIDLSTDTSERTVKFNNTQLTKKKKFDIDHKLSYRLAHAYKHPVVLFEPDDLQLFSGSPSRRRRYIDTIISTINPIYAMYLRRYERILQQRNASLKKSLSTELLFAWNISLAEYGSYIIKQRLDMIEHINAHIGKTYHTITGRPDTVQISYDGSARLYSADDIMNQLESSIEKDRVLGYTTIGPHRHDIESHINQSLTRTTASRGETRSVVLALKFIEMELIKQTLFLDPIIILDDVFSELDATRQKLLTTYTKKYQTIITSTKSIKNANSVTLN